MPLTTTCRPLASSDPSETSMVSPTEMLYSLAYTASTATWSPLAGMVPFSRVVVFSCASAAGVLTWA